MKKLWLHSLALSLGLVASHSGFGQYPAGYNNFGASSYPVQGQNQSILQSLPQVPSGPGMATYNQSPAMNYSMAPYQLAAAQGGGVYGAPAMQAPVMQEQVQAVPHNAPMVPSPQPMQYSQGMQSPMPAHAMPGSYGSDCQSCNQAQPTVQYHNPQPMDYGYQQSIAPACSGYGQEVVSYPHASAGYCGSPVGHAGLGGLPCGAKPWFFGGGVLLFNRIDDDNVPLSFADSVYSPDILGTQDARMGVMPGFEVMAGRYFNCGKNAIAATYWGLFSEDEEALRSRTTGGDYRSRIPFQYVDILDPTLAGPYGMPERGVYDWFDAAYTHSLRRSSDYHNVEVNLLGFAVGCSARNFNLPTAGTLFSGTRGHSGCGYCGGAGCGACASSCSTGCNSCGPSKFATGPCCLTAPACGSRLNMTWLAGVRYFRFEDNLTYAASLNDSVINRSTDDLYYDVNTTNDLVGFQFGSRLDYCLGKRINAYGNAKMGVYGNHSTYYSRLATDYQTAYLNDGRTPGNPDNGSGWMFNESKTDVAFLSELGAGLGVRVSPKWTATCGYRAVIASGVATSPDNVNTAFANYQDVRDFDNRGTLILHGLNIGALYNY